MKFLIFLLLFCSCNLIPKPPAPLKEERFDEVTVRYVRSIYVLNFKGHEYISGSGGVWVHAESCPCKNK